MSNVILGADGRPTNPEAVGQMALRAVIEPLSAAGWPGIVALGTPHPDNPSTLISASALTVAARAHPQWTHHMLCQMLWLIEADMPELHDHRIKQEAERQEAEGADEH